MSNLAEVVSRHLERRFSIGSDWAVDDFKMNYRPGGGCGSRQPDGVASNTETLLDSPSIFIAIQGQLGSVGYQGYLDVIVIDHAEEPEPNWRIVGNSRNSGSMRFGGKSAGFLLVNADHV